MILNVKFPLFRPVTSIVDIILADEASTAVDANV